MPVARHRRIPWPRLHDALAANQHHELDEIELSSGRHLRTVYSCGHRGIVFANCQRTSAMYARASSAVNAIRSGPCSSLRPSGECTHCEPASNSAPRITHESGYPRRYGHRRERRTAVNPQSDPRDGMATERPRTSTRSTRLAAPGLARRAPSPASSLIALRTEPGSQKTDHAGNAFAHPLRSAASPRPPIAATHRTAEVAPAPGSGYREPQYGQSAPGGPVVRRQPGHLGRPGGVSLRSISIGPGCSQFWSFRISAQTRM